MQQQQQGVSWVCGGGTRSKSLQLVFFFIDPSFQLTHLAICHVVDGRR